ILIDLAKRRGIGVTINWKEGLPKDQVDSFFEDYRNSYNFLKHADKRRNDTLPVYDMMMENLKVITSATVNYMTLFRESTAHMRLFLCSLKLYCLVDSHGYSHPGCMQAKLLRDGVN